MSPGGTPPFWVIALAVATLTAGLGVVVLRPWQGPVADPARATWVIVFQLALTVLIMMTWSAPHLLDVRHRFAAQAAATGLTLRLVSSLWANQIATSLSVPSGTVQTGVTIMGGLSGTCLIAMVAALARRNERRRVTDYDAIVDAVVVGAAVALVIWESLAISGDGARLAFSAAAASTVAAASAVFVRLMLSSAWRLVTIRLLAIAVTLSAVVVLQSAYAGLATDPARDHQWELIAVVVYGTVASAVLHPSFRDLVDGGATEPAAQHGIARAVVLCAAMAVPSGVTLFRALHGARAAAADLAATMSVPSAFAGVVITLGVSWRLAQMVRECEATHRLLRHRSLHDDLTGLPNRAHLLEQLEEQIARVRTTPKHTAAGFGLMFLDLDGFKSINDTYGHHAGDTVLIDVAHRLADTVRTDDFVGRMAGDEFVLVCGQPSDEPTLRQLAERLRTAVEEPLPAEFGVVTPKVSIGIISVDHGTATARDAVSTILRRADAQMYAAKTAAAPPAPRTPQSLPRRLV